MLNHKLTVQFNKHNDEIYDVEGDMPSRQSYKEVKVGTHGAVEHDMTECSCLCKLNMVDWSSLRRWFFFFFVYISRLILTDTIIQ